jgi:putative ABC transport system permease protein
MNSVVANIRYALRKLVRSAGFTTTAMITLAVGIGATTAIFSVVYSVLLKPLPYSEPDALVDIRHSAPGVEFPELPHSVGTHVYYREQSRVLEETAVYNTGTSNITGDGDPVRIDVLRTSATLFPVLRVTAALGRTLVEEDNQPGATLVTVLSNAIWRQRFGSDPGVLGNTIIVNNIPREIVGVMPAGFSFPTEDVRLYLPLEIDPANAQFGNFSHGGVARLKPGMTVADAGTELQQLVQRFPERFSDVTPEIIANAQFGVLVTPLLEQIVGDVQQTLLIVLGAVGFVLLIACANVANLFLVRAEGHQKEIAVRTSLGANRGDLIKYFMAESLTLSTLSGLVGVALAVGSLRMLVAMGPEDIPRLSEVGLSLPALGITAAISLLIGCMFGAVPIFKYAAINLAGALKDGGRSSSVGKERHKARNALVVVQVSLALVLLVGSGLMLQSFRALKNVEPGYGMADRLTLQISLPADRYDEKDVVANFHLDAIERLQTIPGVSEVAVISNIPLGGNSSNDLIDAEGIVRGPNELPPVLELNAVSPNYFAQAGIEFSAGSSFERPLNESDALQSVITESAANRFWPNENPIGKRLTSDPLEMGEDKVWYTVVGVVPDVRSMSLTEDPVETVYTQMNGSWPQRNVSYIIHSERPTELLVPAVRAEMLRLDANLPLANIRTFEEIARRSSAQLAFTMTLLGLAAIVALLLGSVGIYGVISYVFAQRTQEIGVRIALGAQQSDVSRMVLKQGTVLTGTGLLIGVAAAFGLTRFMESILFEVSPTDPITFGTVTLVLTLVSLLAAYVPARRAARTDPLEALRAE